MIEVFKQARPATKLVIIVVVLAFVASVTFLMLALTLGGVFGNQRAPFADQFFMGLLSVITLLSAMYGWEHRVMPEIFLTMCEVTRKNGAGTATRIGLGGLLKAFNKAMPVNGHH